MLLCPTICRAQQSNIELFKQYFGSMEPKVAIDSIIIKFNQVYENTLGQYHYPIYYLSGILPDDNFRDLASTVKDVKDSIASPINKRLVFDKDATVRNIKDFRSKATLLPTFYGIIDNKFEGSTEKYINDMFHRSIFLNNDCYEKVRKRPSNKRIEKDPYLNYLVSQIMYADMLDTFNIAKAKWTKLKEITGDSMAFDKSYPLMSAIYSVLFKTTPDLIYDTKYGWGNPNQIQNYLMTNLYYNLKQDKLTQKMIEKALNEYIAENPISKDERERLIASVKGNPKYSNIVNSKFDYSAEKYVDHLLSKSILTNANKRAKFLKNPSKKKIANDPGVNYTLTKMKKTK